MGAFISLTINADADQGAVRATFDRFGFGFDDVPVPRTMPPGRRYLAHRSMCDCGTVIGSGLRDDRPPYTPADLERLRKKGWSEARIERWSEQKLAAEAQRDRSRQERRRAAHQDLASWTELIRALLDTPTVRVVGLMHDFYAHGPGYDDLPLTAEPPKPVAQLTEEALFRLPGGVLADWLGQRTP